MSVVVAAPDNSKGKEAGWLKLGRMGKHAHTLLAFYTSSLNQKLSPPLRKARVCSVQVGEIQSENG